MIFSRFSHMIKLPNGYSLYNSLFLKPVFLSNDEYSVIKMNWKEKNCDGLSQYFQNVFEENKIIVNESADEKVLKKLRSVSQPEAYVAFFIVSECCNLRCKYCFIDDCYINMKEKMMSIDTCEKSIQYYKHILETNKCDNENFIMIYGGEPLTNPAVVKYLVERINSLKKNGDLPANIKVNITTNGTMLNENWIRFFKNNDVSITVSLDGDRDSNDQRVYENGSETFDDVIQECKQIKKEGVKLFLSITLTDNTIKSFDKVMNLIDELDVDGLGFNPLIPKKYSINEEYGKKVGIFLTSAFSHLRTKKIWDARVMPKVKAYVESRIYLYDCAVTSGSQLTFLPNGTIASCHAMVDYPEYNLCTLDDDFSYAKPKLLEWCNRMPINNEKCLSCIALGLCGGTCPSISLHANKSITEMDDVSCIYNRAIVEWLIQDTCSNCTHDAQ
ncbi:7-carboxy-7-deazaguanine synthase [bioreactor metagenome]|uniref:7-carboxy-7-deazaguanine synthase n=1 Tax=bioreactor metagenome TaxID=1076179 RepID=A0A644YYB7_9ZZZZ